MVAINIYRVLVAINFLLDDHSDSFLWRMILLLFLSFSLCNFYSRGGARLPKYFLSIL